MAEFTLYTQPMSRGQIARWALHEAGADYRHVLIDLKNRPGDFRRINPMDKVPVLIHHTADGDRTVTECAAICAYLAETHPAAGLLPTDSERADYWRWLFFAAGPVEQAITSKGLGFAPAPEQQGFAGWGSFDRTMETLKGHLADRQWVCGDRFTMADVYVGSQVDWGLTFGSIPPDLPFVAYAERLQARSAYKAAKAIDNDLIAASRT